VVCATDPYGSILGFLDRGGLNSLEKILLSFTGDGGCTCININWEDRTRNMRQHFGSWEICQNLVEYKT
jgi:hypothetical protein